MVLPQRIRYGEDPSQFAELTGVPGASRGTVVILHGGFWRAAYDVTLARPLAADLAEHGWAAWALEYRRVGAGGGIPETLEDVAAGIDALAGLGVSSGPVIALGHSAGGHLAAWAAARGRGPSTAPVRVPVDAVVAQAAVLDLAAAHRQGLGTGAVADLLGGSPITDHLDPARQVPLSVPVRCLHARDDDVVPFEQSQTYVRRSRAAGADAALIEVDGGHYGLIDPAHPAWSSTRAQLDALARTMGTMEP